MRSLHRLTLAGLILCLCISTDLATKAVVRENLAGSSPQYYLGGLLRLSRWENAGTFMSIGDSYPASVRFWAFAVLFGGFGVSVLVLMLVKPALRHTQLIAGSLIAGGALSNVIDRLSHNGYALDFINIVITPLHFMIFNLADVAIGVGVSILIMLAVRRVTGRPG